VTRLVGLVHFVQFINISGKNRMVRIAMNAMRRAGKEVNGAEPDRASRSLPGLPCKAKHPRMSPNARRLPLHDATRSVISQD
jgi:hypothetical protein